MIEKKREGISEYFGKSSRCIRVKREHFKLRVASQESPKEKGLIPGPSLVNPGVRIGVGIENVVKVNKRSGLEARKDPEQQEGQVAPDLGDMRGVDEENVAGFQLFKKRERALLDGFHHHGADRSVRFRKERVKPVGMGLNKGELWINLSIG
jgi:hypothetical protein